MYFLERGKICLYHTFGNADYSTSYPLMFLHSTTSVGDSMNNRKIESVILSTN